MRKNLRFFKRFSQRFFLFNLLFLSYDFRSTESITTKSLTEYGNPFLYTYILDDLEKRGQYQEAYDLVSDYVLAIGFFDEVAIKTRLRLNIEHLKNDFLKRDLEKFIRLSIGRADYKTALTFLSAFSHEFTSEEKRLYRVLLEGLSGVKNPIGAKELSERSTPPPHN